MPSCSASQPGVGARRDGAGFPERVERGFRMLARLARGSVGQGAKRNARERMHADVRAAGAAQEGPRPLTVLAAVNLGVADDLDRAAVVPACGRHRQGILHARGSAARWVADVLGRTDEAAGEFARIADDRGIAGRQCERDYDALTAFAR